MNRALHTLFLMLGTPSLPLLPPVNAYLPSSFYQGTRSYMLMAHFSLSLWQCYGIFDCRMVICLMVISPYEDYDSVFITLYVAQCLAQGQASWIHFFNKLTWHAKAEKMVHAWEAEKSSVSLDSPGMGGKGRVTGWRQSSLENWMKGRPSSHNTCQNGKSEQWA